MVPVSVCTAVTATPGSTPPWASETVPAMLPVVTVCAVAGAASSSSAQQNAAARLHTALVRNVIRLFSTCGLKRRKTSRKGLKKYSRFRLLRPLHDGRRTQRVGRLVFEIVLARFVHLDLD